MRLISFYIVLLLPVLSTGQIETGAKGKADSLALGQAQAEPDFGLLRAEENYTQFRSESNLVKWQKAKILFRSPKVLGIWGGNYRSEVQGILNQDWTRDNNDAIWFNRIMLHSHWHFGDYLELFAQLRHGSALGRNEPNSPLDRDDTDLHQGFVKGKYKNVELRLGRQELSFGSRRLISLREGANVRQSFDGAKLTLGPEIGNSKQQIDLLFFTFNNSETGIFDNPVDDDELLWGLYWTREATNNVKPGFDYYYLGSRQQRSSYFEGEGQETRHSLGIRVWNDQQKFRYNIEGVVQGGSFQGSQILAWTISSETSYQIPSQCKLVLGLKAEAISGDRYQTDGKLGTFNALYPRGGYFGLLALIGPANLLDIHPSVSLSGPLDIRFTADWDAFWRYSKQDGIYFPSANLNPIGFTSASRFIGNQFGLQMEKALNPFVEFSASYFIFLPGNFIADASPGEILHQFGFSLGVKI
jgi:hypothetical protein